MKRTLALSLCLALAACTPATVVTTPLVIPAPAQFAGRTAADEQISIAVELGYQAFARALELGVDAGVIKGERATKARVAHRAAYRGVLVLREAYKTANAEDFLNAARSANSTIAQAIAIVKGN